MLIILHSGGMMFGTRYDGRALAIPMAAVGKIKVLSIDYRLAPEYRFPSASEDVAAVYRELIKTIPAQNIGIYGCSAGGTLAAQSIAWFQTHQLPRPGAIGLLCVGSSFEGDSFYAPTTPAGFRDPTFIAAQRFYGADADPTDPRVNPFISPSVLRAFPPTVFINSSRDFTMSSATHAHLQLTQAGVPSEIYLWDGLSHAFMYDATLPESREAYGILWRFFDRFLGRAAVGSGR